MEKIYDKYCGIDVHKKLMFSCSSFDRVIVIPERTKKRNLKCIDVIA